MNLVTLESIETWNNFIQSAAHFTQQSSWNWSTSKCGLLYLHFTSSVYHLDHTWSSRYGQFRLSYKKEKKMKWNERVFLEHSEFFPCTGENRKAPVLDSGDLTYALPCSLKNAYEKGYPSAVAWFLLGRAMLREGVGKRGALPAPRVSDETKTRRASECQQRCDTFPAPRPMATPSPRYKTALRVPSPAGKPPFPGTRTAWQRWTGNSAQRDKQADGGRALINLGMRWEKKKTQNRMKKKEEKKPRALLNWFAKGLKAIGKWNEFECVWDPVLG